MSTEEENYIPEITNDLRSKIIYIPEEINEASGINIFGRTLKSFIFSTDVAIIRNNNADAIFSVYPFTPQPAITQALILAADAPIFCGVGGGITGGNRVLDIARDAEFQGASGVVVNQPTKNDIIEKLKKVIEIPIIWTISSIEEPIQPKLDAGVDIINVSGGRETSNIIRRIRENHEHLPIIATGGRNDDRIIETIEAGANAITYTPPSSAELLRRIMRAHRAGETLDFSKGFKK